MEIMFDCFKVDGCYFLEVFVFEFFEGLLELFKFVLEKDV